MIMTAHISLPKLDNRKIVPMTVSKPVITGILRNKLGYKGVVITDDFNMGAVDKKTCAELAVQSINAGVDILLFVGYYDNTVKVWTRIYRAVKSGEIKEAKINDSVKRILVLKHKYIK